MKIIVTILLFLITSNINAQIITKYYDSVNVERQQFDVSLFKEKLIYLKDNFGYKNDNSRVYFKRNHNETDYNGWVYIRDNVIYEASYSEKNTERTLSISGNEFGGFLTSETKEGSTITERVQFYSDGSLQLVGSVKRDENLPQREPPSGTWYQYKPNGILVQKTEYDYNDSLYIFSRDDIRKLVIVKYNAEEYIEYVMYNLVKSPKVITNGKVTADAYWVVSIPEYETPRRDKVLHIDAVTGKILHERVNIFSK